MQSDLISISRHESTGSHSWMQSCGLCVLVSCKQLRQRWQALLSWLSWSCHFTFASATEIPTQHQQHFSHSFCGLVLIWCPQIRRPSAPFLPETHSIPMTHQTTLRISSTLRNQDLIWLHVDACDVTLHTTPSMYNMQFSTNSLMFNSIVLESPGGTCYMTRV